MPEQVKLTELEAYRQEALNAEREGRPCRLRDPREVFKEDPNRDSYLVEVSDENLVEAKKDFEGYAEEKLKNLETLRDSQNDNRSEGSPEITDEVIDERLPSTNPGETQRQVELEHGLSEDLYPEPHITSAPDVGADKVQEVDEKLALTGVANESNHQNTQSTPNPVFAGGAPSEDDEEIDRIAEENRQDETSHANTLEEVTGVTPGEEKVPDDSVSGELRNTPEALSGEVPADGREESHLEGTLKNEPGHQDEGTHSKNLPDLDEV